MAMSACKKLPTKRNLFEVLKDMVLFLVAPVISLTYIALFPVIGLMELVRAKKGKQQK